MGRITKKEVNTKKDYVVVNVYHERYSCDMCVEIIRNKSIVDIYNMYNCVEDFDINKLERQGYHEMGYVYDKCDHYEMNDYDCTKRERKRFRAYHIECLFIVELDKFLEEEVFNCTFMDTNKKYGLVDYCDKPVVMNMNKNIFTILHNRLYDKYKWYQKLDKFIFNLKCDIKYGKRKKCQKKLKH